MAPARTASIPSVNDLSPTKQIAPESIEESQQDVASSSKTPIVEGLMSTSAEKEERTRRLERAQAIFKKYNLDFDETGWEFRPISQTERVHKAPRLRVRWTCHECRTTFGHDKVCAECAHQRCSTCVRYPPKKRKARAAKRAAMAIAASEIPQENVQEGACHECQTRFDIGTQECSNCHHVICDRCLEETLASIEPELLVAASSSRADIQLKPHD